MQGKEICLLRPKGIVPSTAIWPALYMLTLGICSGKVASKGAQGMQQNQPNLYLYDAFARLVGPVQKQTTSWLPVSSPDFGNKCSVVQLDSLLNVIASYL